ncbi:neuroglian [Diaphorina citri]|uniref:Neuroglian n=1 Tax=Diaphorina citri TaxID=121845 RepID=A0A3Q0J5M6_DIACI|nr:neuroglian [Diaphorina citri]
MIGQQLSLCFLALSIATSTALVQSPPRIVKQPPSSEELLFQVVTQQNENEKPFLIECEAEGEPAPNLQEASGSIKSINNSRMTIDPEGNLWFSNVTRQDASEDFYYACSATSLYRSEYKIGNRILLNVIATGISASQNRHALRITNHESSLYFPHRSEYKIGNRILLNVIATGISASQNRHIVNIFSLTWAMFSFSSFSLQWAIMFFFLQVPMSPWANFTFRVIASNKIGKSLPSEHSSVCTTQPDVPFKNPDNVEGRGSTPNNLVISWTVICTTQPKVPFKNPDNVEGRGSTPNNLVISWTVLAFNGAYNGPPSEIISFVTPEGVPGTVQSLEAIPLGSSAFYLKWVKPEQPNGVLMGYKIKYQSVKGTKVGPLLERLPYISDPTTTSAKLAGLEPSTKYRIHLAGYTKAGDGADYFIEHRTRGTDNVAPGKPNFKLVRSGTENGYGAFKVIWEPNPERPGSHFFVKYSLPLLLDGVSIMPSDTVATAGWFIGMLLAIAFLILVLILVCLIKRNRGGKYAVHEREAAHGRHDYPEEPGFNEYSQPLDGKPRTRSSMSSEKHPVESDTDSMAEYGDGDTAQFTEDGSFIGLYGTGGKKKTQSPPALPPPGAQNMSAIATYV